MQRRRLLHSIGAAAVSPLAATSRAADDGPIRIGLMAPLTGVVATGGKEIVEGVELYLDQMQQRLAGRPVELMVEDDASDPAIAVQKARRLVEQRGAHFLVGNLLANTGLAVADYVRGNGVPYFIPVVAADDLTQRQRIPNVVRVAGFSASQMSRPLADYAFRKRKWRRIVTLSQDYAFGWEQCGGFTQLFTELGGQVPQQFWHPINTADFDPLLSKIQALAPDAVFAMETGADATRLIRQWKSFGLKGRLPLLGALNTTDQSVIRSLGDECEGIVSSAHFCEGGDAPATVKFVADYERTYAKLPSFYGLSHYACMMWLDQALQSIQGRVEDRAALLKAVGAVTLANSPLGRAVSLDRFGNPVYDVFIREVKRRPNGRFWNVPVDVYPNVSQFWTYDPDAYLKQPPYSRAFQGPRKG